MDMTLQHNLKTIKEVLKQSWVKGEFLLSSGSFSHYWLNLEHIEPHLEKINESIVRILQNVLKANPDIDTIIIPSTTSYSISDIRASLKSKVFAKFHQDYHIISPCEVKHEIELEGILPEHVGRRALLFESLSLHIDLISELYEVVKAKYDCVINKVMLFVHRDINYIESVIQKLDRNIELIPIILFDEEFNTRELLDPNAQPAITTALEHEKLNAIHHYFKD